mgnify:CR=1 FL=1
MKQLLKKWRGQWLDLWAKLPLWKRSYNFGRQTQEGPNYGRVFRVSWVDIWWFGRLRLVVDVRFIDEWPGEFDPQ